MLPVPEFSQYVLPGGGDCERLANGAMVEAKVVTRLGRASIHEQERNDRYGRFGHQRTRLLASQLGFGEEG